MPKGTVQEDGLGQEEPPPPYSGTDTLPPPRGSLSKDNATVLASTLSSKKEANLWEKLCGFFNSHTSSSAPNSKGTHCSRDQVEAVNNHTSVTPSSQKWWGQQLGKCRLCHRVCGETHVPTPCPPSIGGHRYRLASRHCPPKYQSISAFGQTPWCFQLDLFVNDPAEISQPFPWRDYPNRCYYDVIGVEPNLRPNRQTFARTIKWALHDGSATTMDRVLVITGCSDDAQWLADLPRADISSFISMESATGIAGFWLPPDDSLSNGQVFFEKTLESMKKPDVSYTLGLDDPELRQIVEEDFEKHLRHPKDALEESSKRWFYSGKSKDV